MDKEMEYKFLEFKDDHRASLGKKDGDYVIQFSRPMEDEDKKEGAPTCRTEIKDDYLITAIRLSPEALQALALLYAEDIEMSEE